MPPAPTTKSSKSTAAIQAFEFLERQKSEQVPPNVACFGSDDFLRRRAIKKTIQLCDFDESTVRVFEGEESEWRDVHDELATRSLFDAGGRRLVVVRGADKFVTRNRDAIERWVNQPAEDSTLVLEVQTLPSNTILYKSIGKQGWLISCSSQMGKELSDWVGHWAKTRFKLQLTSEQKHWIVDRIGPICGLIDCELAKLALFADNQGHVSNERAHELVGGWRTKTVWELADAVAEGHISAALEAIDKLILAGQSVVGLSAQLSWSLRRYGVAAQTVEQFERMGEKRPLTQALERAGFKTFEIAKAGERLRRIGRPRAKEMLTWLVELEQQLKGSHSQEDRARFALESLLMRLSDSR